MTLDKIASSKKDMLSCGDVADVVGIGTYNLHRYIMEYPERIGFPVMITGNRIRIPRIPFLRFMGIETRCGS
jgi:hypothetical protein